MFQVFVFQTQQISRLSWKLYGADWESIANRTGTACIDESSLLSCPAYSCTTNRPSNPPFSEPSSHGSRAVMIPIMLAGAVIFSRSMWAVVDVLLPPALAPTSAHRADPGRHRTATALSDRFKGRGTGGDSGGDRLRDSPAVGSWRGNAVAGSATVYGAKAGTVSAHHVVRNRQEPPSKEKERGMGVVLTGNYPDRVRSHSDGESWGREAAALKAARQPPTPLLPPNTAVIDFDDEEDDGWVSEEEQVMGHDPEDDCDEVDWDSRVEEERADGAGDGPADKIDEVSGLHEEGNDGPQVSTGRGNYDLDDTPRAIRSWHAGSIRRTDPVRRQKWSAEGGADREAGNRGGAMLGTRGEGDGRDAAQAEEVSNHHGTLESVEEGDEDTDDCFKSPSDESGSQKEVRLHRSLEQPSGAALAEDSPRSIDEFIVKK